MMATAADLDREQAYVSDIPPGAEERVTEVYPDGARKEAEYWLNGERVGLRRFRSNGELAGETAFRDGVRHGMEYRWDVPGKLLSAEPYERGIPHGTARQWADDGRLIGTYTLDHGTGIDLWWEEPLNRFVDQLILALPGLLRDPAQRRLFLPGQRDLCRRHNLCPPPGARASPMLV